MKREEAIKPGLEDFYIRYSKDYDYNIEIKGQPNILNEPLIEIGLR